MIDSQPVEKARQMQMEALQKYLDLAVQGCSFCAFGGCIVKMHDIKPRFDELVIGGMNKGSAYMLAIMEASEGMTQNDRP